MEKFVLDACAIIAFLKAEAGFERMEEVFIGTRSGEIELFMSAVTFGEVCLYLYKNLTFEKAKKQIEEIQNLWNINFIDANIKDSNQAGYIKSLAGLGYPDCFVLVLAKNLNATILTKDKEFQKFEREFRIEWL